MFFCFDFQGTTLALWGTDDVPNGQSERSGVPYLHIGISFLAYCCSVSLCKLVLA